MKNIKAIATTENACGWEQGYQCSLEEAVEDVKNTMMHAGDLYINFYDADDEFLGTLYADGTFEEAEPERGWIADWADYDDSDEHPETGCDFWNEDGSSTDYPGMTVNEVRAELEECGWTVDDERNDMYAGTDRGNVIYMVRWN